VPKKYKKGEKEGEGRGRVERLFVLLRVKVE
jgi:hypothetical protein